MSISNNMPYVEHYTIDQLHSLVGDYRRTNSYSYWIMSGVCEGKTVVDCGAGSGLCSWLALRGGASRVVACDISPEVCDYLRGQFQHMPQVTVVQLDLCHDDMPSGDIYIHELVGNSLLGEGMSQIFSNMRSQGIENIYPHHARISIGSVSHDPEVPSTNCDHLLSTYSREFTRFLSDYAWNNSLTVDYPNLIATGITHIADVDLRKPIPQHLQELELDGDIIWEVGFDPQYVVSYSNINATANNWNAKTPYAEFVKWCNIESFGG